MSVEEVRARLARKSGPKYWRSLEELADTEEFQELLEREFPRLLPESGSGLGRRRFLQLMGASLALAGLNACSLQPDEKIVPYIKQPEELVPGKPLYFASATAVGPFGRGILIESNTGRPTKIEGNPDHPSSQGATDLFDQASVLDLYDPSRSQAPTYLGDVRTWEAFADEINAILQAQASLQGEGLAVVMPNSSSPTLRAQIARLREVHPRARFVFYDAAGNDLEREGLRTAYGQPTQIHYDVSKAEVIVCFDSDLLTEGPGAVRYARDFARNRRVVENPESMNRLYCVESSPTNTGVLADHRFASSPADLEATVLALAAALGIEGANANRATAPIQDRARRLAAELRSHRSRSLVVAGPSCSADVHALVAAMNESLGNVRNTVIHRDPVLLSDEDGFESLRRLVAEIHAGGVEVAIFVGGNPVYDAPAELDLAKTLSKVPRRIRVGIYADETSRYCQWHVPMSHLLESWSDLVGHDGTVSIIQPGIAPLYGTKSVHEIFECFLGNPQAKGHDLVQATWRNARGGANFEKTWRRWVHNGVVEGSATEHRPRTFRPKLVAEAARRLTGRTSSSEELHLVFRPDPTVGDGSRNNNAWLQECPKPHSRITWDNAALISPRTAERLQVSNEELVRIEVGDKQIEIAAWVQPGHAENTITLHLGYGRTHAGPVGNGCGVDIYPLRTQAQRWTMPGAKLTPLKKRFRLASTQLHQNMEGRDLVRMATLHDLHQGHLHEPHEEVDPNASIMPGYDYSEGYRWGMSVDLTACTGCNACVIACHSENNTSIVGKEQVLLGRELHWIRIDRYYGGDLDDPQIYLQPVMCQQCEQAPCEVVCPVEATIHTSEGINAMAYNRCVGTRYCSNNCPYKVRRFNFLQYADEKTESLALGHNPDVTVRSRGVMEKCTYCIQRINHKKIEATVQDLPLAEVGLQTACQQVCPTEAIQFGDLNDPTARVSKWKRSELDYGILVDLGTRPRTTYLTRIANPNPELERS
jgi:molybdopterin-containing oxidoreductase family iron-sulfur binding subunit